MAVRTSALVVTFLRTAALGAALAFGPMAGAAISGGFSSTLSNDQQINAGVTALEIDQRAALDRMVASELAQIRSGQREDFEGTFMSRRTDDEIKSAGLDQLSPEQLTKLNEYAAAVLSSRPQPRERPRLKESDVISAKRKPEIHGEVTVAYGFGSGGREAWGSSLLMNYYDPDKRFGISVGISQFEGDGLWGFGYPGSGYSPWGWGGYGYGSRYYLHDPFYFDTPYSDFPARNTFAEDDFGYRGRYSRTRWRR